MRALKLVIEPFHFISLLKLECIKKMNDHGMLKISGIISEEDSATYQHTFFDEQSVCLKAITEDNEEMILFQGIVTKMAIEIEGQVNKLNIYAKTGSYLLDRQPHVRLFQDSSLSYESVMQTIIRNDGGDVLMLDKYQNETGQFIVQYKETDWGFCKRLAANLSLPLLPEFQQPGKLFHIGINNKNGGTLDSKEYSLITSMAEEWTTSLIWSERGIYRVVSREIYQLGEHLIFNKKRLTVTKVESYLQGGELWNNYYLCLLKTTAKTLQYNQKIQGVSMKGTVQAVQGTKVQVSIHEDENQTKGGHWFDYATVYSTPDGTGWYCMPEVGDEIRLAFPSKDENSAYVASSVHLDGGAGRDDPNQKFWKNKWGKEVRFTPNSLILTNGAGLSLILDDEAGIRISSNKSIHLSGLKEISMNSGSHVQVSGNSGVSIQQGSASIQMIDEINISGGKISLN